MTDDQLQQRTEVRFNLNEPVRRVVDSTVAIAFARLVMPVALTVIGYFLVATVSDFKDQNLRMWAAITKMSNDIQAQAVSAVVTDLRLKEESQRLDDNRKRLDDHEARLRELARVHVQ